MRFQSTRDSKQEKFTSAQVIRKGLADDGGLFVPDHIPALEKSLTELSKMSYQEVAYEVMKLFLTDFTGQSAQAKAPETEHMETFTWQVHFSVGTVPFAKYSVMT